VEEESEGRKRRMEVKEAIEAKEVTEGNEGRKSEGHYEERRLHCREEGSKKLASTKCQRLEL
jgi:hypothetical protein